MTKAEQLKRKCNIKSHFLLNQYGFLWRTQIQNIGRHFQIHFLCVLSKRGLELISVIIVLNLDYIYTFFMLILVKY